MLRTEVLLRRMPTVPLAEYSQKLESRSYTARRSVYEGCTRSCDFADTQKPALNNTRDSSNFISNAVISDAQHEVYVKGPNVPAVSGNVILKND